MGFTYCNKRVFIFALLVAILIFFGLPPVAAAEEAKEQGLSNLQLLEEVYRDILESYAGEITPEELEIGAIEGMLDSLDPYSEYFTPEEYRDFQEGTEGVFGGVGMQIEKVGDYVRVVAPLPGTPAEEAGIKAGDKIIKVGTEDVKGYTLKKVADMIKGEPGTVVLITVLREGVEEPLYFSITRELIKLDVVQSELMEDGIGYIRLTTFSTSSAVEFKKAVNELKAKGAKGLILDLRNNPGGYLGAALSVASIFVPEKGHLVHVVSPSEGENSYWSTSPALGMPLVVLVNEGSASGSEIVAGAVQDHEVGVLVGTRTFGKASVQSVKELPDGAAYKLTTAKYLTPDKRDINGVGLKPDYVVEDPEQQLVKAEEILAEMLGMNGGQGIVFQVGDKKITVNGSVTEAVTAPYIAENRLMVPLRLTLKGLEGAVTLKGDIIYAELDGKKLRFTVGAKRAAVNGKEIELPWPVEIRGNTAFIPLRFFADEFGADIKWDGAKQEARLIIK